MPAPSAPLPRRFYCGRFAPSPTGPLHFGSLLAALASYCDARHVGGQWLVRIEDVDGGREVSGAAENILQTLHRYGFRWDAEAPRQSTRSARYRQALDALIDAGHVYPCTCSRQRLQHAPLGASGERVYPGYCRPESGAFSLQAHTLLTLSPRGRGCPEGAGEGGRQPFYPSPPAPLSQGERGAKRDAPLQECKHLSQKCPNAIIPFENHETAAWRLRVPETPRRFTDLVQGEQSQHLPSECGDFILKRRDGFYAYHLAVVVDDIDQGITDIVRGADLLALTPRHLWLYECLGHPPPRYSHIPVAVTAEGQKLSKQTRAPALPENPLPTLLAAWRFLAQAQPPQSFSTPDAFWDWAIAHWNPSAIPRVISLPAPF